MNTNNLDAVYDIVFEVLKTENDKVNDNIKAMPDLWSLKRTQTIQEMSRNIAKQILAVVADGKFNVVVDGPDDIYGPMCEIDALRQANEINKLYRQQLLENGEDAILCLAVVEKAEPSITDIS